MAPQVTDKDEFLIGLGGKSERKKVLNRLAKEQDLLRIKIEELIGDSIIEETQFVNSKHRALWRILNRMPGQHKIIFDTNCKKSPYGICGEATQQNILKGKCVWCSREFI